MTQFSGNLSQIDLRLLQVFRAVAEAQGYSGAELALGKSKPSISMDISALETRLGLVLCRRGRSGFSLTKAGAEVLEATQELFGSLDLFRNRMADISYESYGDLTIALDDSVLYSAGDILSSFIRKFYQTYPKTQLSFSSAPPAISTHSVIEGRADLGLSTIPRSMSELETEPVMEEVLELYCGALHPLANVKAEKIDEKLVRTYDFVDVAVRQNATVREFMDGVSVTSSANMPTRLLFILSGEFLGFLPVSFAQFWVNQDAIVPLSIAKLSYTNELHLIARRESSDNQLVAGAWTLLRDAFSPDAQD